MEGSIWPMMRYTIGNITRYNDELRLQSCQLSQNDLPASCMQWNSLLYRVGGPIIRVSIILAEGNRQPANVPTCVYPYTWCRRSLTGPARYTAAFGSRSSGQFWSWPSRNGEEVGAIASPAVNEIYYLVSPSLALVPEILKQQTFSLAVR